MVILGIIISTSLIVGINVASDAQGTYMFRKNFSTLYCDFRIESGNEFDGNFSKYRDIISPLKENYSEIEGIYTSFLKFFYNTITFNFSGAPINWTYYSGQNYNDTLFNSLDLYGIDFSFFTRASSKDFITFSGNESNIIELGSREVLIDRATADDNNLSKGQNITVGNLFQYYNYTGYGHVIENYTFESRNLTVAGFFSIDDDNKDVFNSLFGRSYYYSSGVMMLSTPEVAYEIFSELMNVSKYNLTYSIYYYWGIGVYTDHSKYDFLTPSKIEGFFQRFTRDVVYSSPQDDFTVINYGLNLINSVKNLIMQYKLIIFAISIPVLILGGYLVRTTYFVILHNRRREIGLLKCRNATNIQLYLLYYSEAVIFGVIGGAIGVFSGYFSASYIIKSLSPELSGISLQEFFSLTGGIDGLSIGVGVVVGILLAVFSTFGPIKHFVKLKTVDALQKYNVEVQTKARIRRLDWILFVISLTSILITIFYDDGFLQGLPSNIRAFLDIIIPIIMGFMPLAPFILTYAVVKFICNFSLRFYAFIVSKASLLFNKKTNFFVSRNLIRNRARSTRLIFIIAMGLSFLILSDILSYSQVIFEKDVRSVYFGADANFYVYSSNISINDSEGKMYDYIDYLKGNSSLNVSDVALLGYSRPIEVIGIDDGGIIIYTGDDGSSSIFDSASNMQHSLSLNFGSSLSAKSYLNPSLDPEGGKLFVSSHAVRPTFSSSFRIAFIDVENYTRVIPNVEKYIQGGPANAILEKLKTTENATLVPSAFLSYYNFKVGDSIFMKYTNMALNQSSMALKIVGSYTVWPGIEPSSNKFYQMFSFICQRGIIPNISLERGFNFLVKYKRGETMSGDLLSKESLTVLNENVISSLMAKDPLVSARDLYMFMLEGNSLVFSMLNFLNIEKIYLLTLVAAGIGVIMYISIQEKAIDLGMLRAKGVRKTTIFHMQLSEGAILLLFGSLISFIGIFSAFAMNKVVDYFTYSYIAIPRSFGIPLMQIAIELVLSISVFIIIIYLATVQVTKRSDIKNISEIFRIS
ncbi:MAG: FtsX-like permease family protein [Promethearchaeota archaeon]